MTSPTRTLTSKILEVWAARSCQRYANGLRFSFNWRVLPKIYSCFDAGSFSRILHISAAKCTFSCSMCERAEYDKGYPFSFALEFLAIFSAGSLYFLCWSLWMQVSERLKTERRLQFYRTCERKNLCNLHGSTASATCSWYSYEKGLSPLTY